MKNPFLFLLTTIIATLPAAAESAKVTPAALDTVRALGELRDLPILGFQMQSSCTQTPGGIEFRRGLVEFDIPVFPEEVLQATLVLPESRGWVSFEIPPDTHEISYYPADRSVTVGDFDIASTPLATFQTQRNVPPETFRFDVTDIVNQSFGQGLGFRVKLQDDPYSACIGLGGYRGTAFTGLEFPDFPHLEITLPTTAIVSVDIAPRTCPSPLKVKSNFLYVAIAGDAAFDASSVDPETVRLEGVPPIAGWTRDIAAPLEPYFGRRFSTECNTTSKDGPMDLLLRFETSSIVQALAAKYGAPPRTGQLLNLRLIGNLLEAMGGAPILGEDVVVVQRGPIVTEAAK